MQKWKLLRSKRFWLTLLIDAAMLIAVLLLMRHVQVLLNSDVRITLTEIATQNKDVITSKLQLEVNNLDLVARHVSERMLVASADQTAQTDQIEIARTVFLKYATEKADASLYFADEAGNAVYTYGQTVNISGRRYFQRAMQGIANISERTVSRMNGEDIFVISVPIAFGGETIGTVQRQYSPTEMYDICSNSMFSDKGYMYIVNEDGYILITSQQGGVCNEADNYYRTLYLEDPDASKQIESDLHAQRSGFMETQIGGEKIFSVYTPIEDVYDWYLISSIATSAVSPNGNKIISLFYVILLAVALFFACMMGYSLSARKRRQQELERLAQRILRNVSKLQEVCGFTVNHDYYAVSLIDLKTGEYESFSGERDDFGEALERGSFAEAVQRRCRDSVYAEDHAAYRSFLDLYRLADTLRDPAHPVAELRFRMLDDSGVLSWHMARAFFFNAQQDQVLVCVQDIEQEERQKQALQEALTAAERANAAKSDFLSRMSHDIRTPMNAIIGMATIARMHNEDADRVADCVGKILLSSHFLLSLINDILDVSKIESGRLNIAREVFDFSEIISSVTMLTYNDAASRNIRFEVSIDPLLARRYTGDALRLKQILMNLLSNALKFTGGEGKPGVVRLTVQPTERSGERDWVNFSVEDNGIGMSESFQKHMFDPFEQESANQRGLTGTGLGLTIANKLVQLMGGTLTVQSALEEGSTFTALLPLDIPTDAPAPVALRASFDGVHLLVIDDDPITCEHLAEILTRLHVDADSSLSGAKGLQMVSDACAQGYPYDVVLLDWSMPDIDGAEITQTIRRCALPQPVVILMSSFDWSVIEDAARGAGVDHFINKPLFEDNLRDLLAHTLQPDTLCACAPKQDIVFEGQTLLLIEDNDLNAEIAQTLLECRNLQIVRAENGQVGVELFAQAEPGTFAAVLMDVRMPIMNGLDATRSIRALDRPDAKSIPIIAMSANAFTEDVAQSIAAGMNEHVSKPIEIDAVCAMLKRYLS